ncbi:MAG: hypothetical protein EOP66_05530 [Sphingomonas sp.]|nr:MAG: hypothetical protein EOP66_05530 [Sphingomonas sp.]
MTMRFARAGGWVAAAIGLIAASASATPRIAGTPSCRVQVPADLDSGNAVWLGACARGRAQALGVLRVGARAPYQFFLGRVEAGRPVTGVLVLDRSQLMDAVRFDSALRAVHTDGLKPGEIEGVFRIASAGAQAAAQRFLASGNRSSAAFYAKMAHDYREPPFE